MSGEAEDGTRARRGDRDRWTCAALAAFAAASVVGDALRSNRVFPSQLNADKSGEDIGRKERSALQV